MTRPAHKSEDDRALLAALTARLAGADLEPTAEQPRTALTLEGGAVLPKAFREAGFKVTPWTRFAGQAFAPTPWPPEGLWDVVAVAQPRSREETLMLLHAAAGRLAPQGQLFFYGLKEDGIEGAARQLAKEGIELAVASIKHHGRILHLLWPATLTCKTRLEDWQESVSIQLPQKIDEAVADKLNLFSWPGLFAHGRLDAGTRLLLESLQADFSPPAQKRARVLDYGSGIGVIGACLKTIMPELECTLLDIDALALHAAKLNLPAAKQINGASLLALGRPVQHQPFDWIVSNPPLHNPHLPSGAATHDILANLLLNAGDYLAAKGELRLVTPMNVPVQKLAAKQKQPLTRLAQRDGYCVWSLKKP